MVKHKKFMELATGKVFEVIDQFEDIAILDSRAKVKVSNLLNKNLYDEYIDPNHFFRNESLVSAFTEKIRQLPLENIRESKQNSEFLKANSSSPFSPTFNDSAVLPYDPEEEKRELMEKARRMFQNQNPNGNNPLSKFENLIDEESQVRNIEVRQQIEDEDIDYRQTDHNIPQIKQQPTIMSSQESIDPILSMFRNVKRNHDFSMNFSLNHKIPRLDFIEMMEDSYNTSIIEFLAEEFTNLILLNPDLLKRKIGDEIRKLVYGESSTEKADDEKNIENAND